MIEHTGAENTELGLYRNESVQLSIEKDRLETFIAIMRSGGTEISVFENIQPRRWEKVVWNVAWNAITTLTDQDVAAWLSSSDDAVHYTRRLMGEVIAVAGACGVYLKEDLADTLLHRAKELGPLRTSMQGDREAGRMMEIEVILGVPVKKGREKGVSTPCLESLYVLLLAINRKIGSPNPT